MHHERTHTNHHHDRGICLTDHYRLREWVADQHDPDRPGRSRAHRHHADRSLIHDDDALDERLRIG